VHESPLEGRAAWRYDVYVDMANLTSAQINADQFCLCRLAIQLSSLTCLPIIIQSRVYIALWSTIQKLPNGGVLEETMVKSQEKPNVLIHMRRR